MRGGLRLPARQHRWEIGRVQQGNRPRAIAEIALADDPVAAAVGISLSVDQQERLVGDVRKPEDG